MEDNASNNVQMGPHLISIIFALVIKIIIYVLKAKMKLILKNFWKLEE
jgi:hypothetical protein